MIAVFYRVDQTRGLMARSLGRKTTGDGAMRTARSDDFTFAFWRVMVTVKESARS